MRFTTQSAVLGSFTHSSTHQINSSKKENEEQQTSSEDDPMWFGTSHIHHPPIIINPSLLMPNVDPIKLINLRDKYQTVPKHISQSTSLAYCHSIIARSSKSPSSSESQLDSERSINSEYEAVIQDISNEQHLLKAALIQLEKKKDVPAKNDNEDSKVNVLFVQDENELLPFTPERPERMKGWQNALKTSNHPKFVDHHSEVTPKDDARPSGDKKVLHQFVEIDNRTSGPNDTRYEPGEKTGQVAAQSRLSP
ncbi:uncharacterized protein I206_105407 [Kwoniella pini CBS 10737]|uniref:Uncharacterized protein n=1 Tax=Kwoniella pini CBS 10737 TaxID=1296096 RepID=A0A1B9I4C0_9TREE|nr:uncharacterized protein I206_03687 [Kwoniella pini CBS 10737]OCF50366.1 hypothetical protein I206_03687 [Kwoniella pini CBS 10737]